MFFALLGRFHKITSVRIVGVVVRSAVIVVRDELSRRSACPAGLERRLQKTKVGADMTHVSKLHSILSPKPLQFMQLSLVKNRVFKFTGTAELSLSLQVNLLTVYCLFVSIVTLLEFCWYGVKHMTINLFVYLCLYIYILGMILYVICIWSCYIWTNNYLIQFYLNIYVAIAVTYPNKQG